MEKPYVEYVNKVVQADNRFKHVMAIALDPKSEYKKGVIRGIISREGDIHIKGYVDRSELYLVESDSLEKFEIKERLEIKNEKGIIDQLIPEGWDFIGLEDPDIWIDKEKNLTHLYFTIPIKPPKDTKDKTKIHLGHAVGKDLDTLEMTMPVLMDNGKFSAKELSIAPINKQGLRFNLIESRDRHPDNTYSVVQVAKVREMGEPWEFGEIVFHPKEHNLPWIGGHASPGPLLPKTFLDIGEGKMLGIINGREANEKVRDKIKYGIFSAGLFIYDYENGRIEWVSPEPLIRDSEATTITFASQFVETGPGVGILYAHVDDSFVRAYKLDAAKIKLLLPS